MRAVQSQKVEVEVNLRPTVSRAACLGVGLPSRAHDQIFVFCLTIAGFLMWGALSHEKKCCSPIAVTVDTSICYEWDVLLNARILATLYVTWLPP
jgi:hypothetical protein